MLVRPMMREIRNTNSGPQYAELFNYGVNKNEKLVHEHDFIPMKIADRRNCYVHCLTCDSYFCLSCGKTLNIHDFL